jgi:hypothetical protein
VVAAFGSRVQDGLLHDRAERVQALQRAGRLLASDEAAEQAEGIDRFLSLAEEDLRLASTIAIENRVVRLEGGRRETNAYVARVGLVSEFFVSEDRADVGLSVPGTVEWQSVDGEERRPLERAVGILRGRHAPELVSVPARAGEPRQRAGSGS